MRFRRKYDSEASTRARVNARVRNSDASMTQQSAAADCDLNVLVKRFGIDKGPLAPIPTDPRYYGEFDDTLDLQTALARVHEAKNRFDMLPASLRAQFDNDPGLLWSWVNDPQNWPEAVEMGLLKRQSPAAASTPAGGTSGNPPPANAPPGAS